jgi:hypothetical protein
VRRLGLLSRWWCLWSRYTLVARRFLPSGTLGKVGECVIAATARHHWSLPAQHRLLGQAALSHLLSHLFVPMPGWRPSSGRANKPRISIASCILHTGGHLYGLCSDFPESQAASKPPSHYAPLYRYCNLPHQGVSVVGAGRALKTFSTFAVCSCCFQQHHKFCIVHILLVHSVHAAFSNIPRSAL